MHDGSVEVSLKLWWRAALLTGLAMLVQQAATAPAMAQTVSYSRDPNTVVASYRVDVGEIAESIQEGSMPPWYYLPLHADAKLTQAEEDALVAGLVATLRASPPGGG